MNIDTKNIKRKKPINRNNLFTSRDCINLQISIGREYVNKVLNQTVILYQVDHENTKTNDIYKESDFGDISFKAPIEINVMYRLNGAELKTYDQTVIKGYYVKLGKLEFQVYQVYTYTRYEQCIFPVILWY